MEHTSTVRSKPRARLTENQAIYIFTIRSSGLSASKIAKSFSVSEKAIRDIWTGRTWSTETHHLDTARTVVLKQVGRPKGCRDQKPRKKRVVNPAHLMTNFEFPNFVAAQYNDSRNTVESADVSSQKERVMRAFWLETTDPCKQVSHSKWVQTCAEEDVPHWCQETLPCCFERIDEQLYTWNESLWINSENPDPFSDDWAPASCPRL
jgi:hypothetical protein